MKRLISFSQKLLYCRLPATFFFLLCLLISPAGAVDKGINFGTIDFRPDLSKNVAGFAEKNSAYILGEKDTINVQVYVGGDQQIAADLTVDNDGRITVPILGSIQAKGLTLTQLEQNIRTPLGRDYFVNPQVILKVTGFRSLSFFISGAVNNPGEYNMEREPTLMELIGKAGGLKEGYGHLAYVTHKKDDGVTKVDLAALLSSGSGRRNIRLKNGDTVQIPSRTEVDQTQANVFIEGEVKEPGMISYRPGLTALNACVMAGGFTEIAAPENATIIREVGQQKTVIKVDLKRVRNGTVPDTPLRPGDFVNIPEETKVYIEGEVKNPGMFPYRPGLTVLYACVMAGGFNEFAALDRANIIRKVGQQKTIIKIDLEKVKSGTTRDPALQPGDLVNIPKKDAQTTNIYIEGEVKNPGMFPYRSGMTVLNACVMAGGFNEFAALDRTTIVRKIGLQKRIINVDLEKVRSGKSPDTVLQPGDFVNVPKGDPEKNNIYIEGEVKNPGMFPYSPGLTALNACVMAGGFNEFAAPNRTKVIRKDGDQKKVIRIDLEDVKAGDIPDLPLEPGDFINVPETWL